MARFLDRVAATFASNFGRGLSSPQSYARVGFQEDIDSLDRHELQDLIENYELEVGRLVSRGNATDVLLTLLWTDRLAQTDDPGGEAKLLRKTVLDLCRSHDPSKLIDVDTYERIKELLNTIVYRSKRL